ncbi:MAG: hypothetical protein ABSF69_04295 [Polyangiaceae bacterium]|jgi:riboflavin biosynthesis pyrimidine reductase
MRHGNRLRGLKDGVSYVIAADEAMDARPLLELLGRELGILRLLVEGAVM